MIRSIRAVGKAALERGASRRAGQRAHGVIPAWWGWGIAGREALPTCVSPASTGGCHGGKRTRTCCRAQERSSTRSRTPGVPRWIRACTRRQRGTRQRAATGGPGAIAGTAREATPSTGHAGMQRLSQEALSRPASRWQAARRVRGMGVASRLQPVPSPGCHCPRGRGAECVPTTGRRL
jgi:hypothetical protein